MKVEVMELLAIKSNHDIPYAPKSAKAGQTYKGTQVVAANGLGPKAINISSQGLAFNEALAAQLDDLESSGYTGLIEVQSEKAPNGININIVSVTRAKEGARVGLVKSGGTVAKPDFVKTGAHASGRQTTTEKKSGFDDPEVIARITRNQALSAAVQLAKNGQEAIALAEIFASYIQNGVPTLKEVKATPKKATVDSADDENF